MYTLVLIYLASKNFTRRTEEAVRSTYIPQIGSLISGGNVRYSTHQVASVAHSVSSGGEMDQTVYVYLKEVDLDEVLG